MWPTKKYNTPLRDYLHVIFFKISDLKKCIEIPFAPEKIPNNIYFL